MDCDCLQCQTSLSTSGFICCKHANALVDLLQGLQSKWRKRWKSVSLRVTKEQTRISCDKPAPSKQSILCHWPKFTFFASYRGHPALLVCLVIVYWLSPKKTWSSHPRPQRENTPWLHTQLTCEPLHCYFRKDMTRTCQRGFTLINGKYAFFPRQ